MIRLLLILCLTWLCQSVTFTRYDQTNFAEIATGSGFEVATYNAIHPNYGIPTPPEGADSGGAFLFDVYPYSCMAFALERGSILGVNVSFWCGPDGGDLRIESNCQYTSIRLCDVKTGSWNVSYWEQTCMAGGSILVVELCGNGLHNGTAVGYEFIEARSIPIMASTTSKLPTAVTTPPSNTTDPSNCCCCCDSVTCPPQQ